MKIINIVKIWNLKFPETSTQIIIIIILINNRYK